MNKELSIPPKSKSLLTQPKELVKKLSVLVGTKFLLSGKTRTDGSNARKVVAKTLVDAGLPEGSGLEDYSVLPPKGKGVPRILREFIDTYIVTTGTSYNLQVWNRNPTATSIQVEYSTGQHLSARDVRFVFLRVNSEKGVLDSIIVLTPDYIESKFGKFGKPTIKHQIIISSRVRNSIIKRNPSLIFETDTLNVQNHLCTSKPEFTGSFRATPSSGNIASLEFLRDKIALKLIGAKLAPGSTKNRGQELEISVGKMLGYNMQSDLGLVGGYPDIRNQALEVKVQDSPTVDLGKYSPQFEEEVPDCLGLMTTDIRYLIALTEANDGLVTGVVLCPGAALGNYFSYVSGTSYKCQRSIPMNFFDQLKGKCVFNP
jgi:hypothetical protein